MVTYQDIHTIPKQELSTVIRKDLGDLVRRRQVFGHGSASLEVCQAVHGVETLRKKGMRYEASGLANDTESEPLA